MNPSSKIETIPIPPRLALRPRDERGYPVPAAVLIDDDGKPDFRVTDMQKWLPLARERRCGLCGEPLGKFMCFIGGPISHKSRFFTDLPMHRSCAEYALVVCPYLAIPNFKYAKDIEIEGFSITKSALVTTTQPEFFFLGVTKGYETYRHQTTLLLHAEEWQRVDWWQHGVKVGAPE